MLRPARLVLVAWEILLVGAALALLANGVAWAPFVLAYALVNAAIVGLILVLERPRYRSEPEDVRLRPTRSDEPVPPGFAPTDEVFVDPTSGGRVRVWADRVTGERRYRPDSD